MIYFEHSCRARVEKERSAAMFFSLTRKEQTSPGPTSEKTLTLIKPYCT